MPRFTRFAPLIALLALPLASCFTDVGECPTCPAANSASLDVQVPQAGPVDSIQVRVDGGSQVSVRRNRRHTFQNLGAGTHEVTYTQWTFINEILSSRTATFRITLERGETRTILFHNDYPLIVWAPTPVRHPTPTRVG